LVQDYASRYTSTYKKVFFIILSLITFIFVNPVILSKFLILSFCTNKYLARLYFHTACGTNTAVHSRTESSFSDFVLNGILHNMPTKSKTRKSNFAKPQMDADERGLMQKGLKNN